MPNKSKKLALKSGIQAYKILTNDDEVCIPSLSSNLVAVHALVLYSFCGKIIWVEKCESCIVQGKIKVVYNYS